MSIEDVDFQNQLDVGPIGPTGPRGFTGLAGQNGFNGSTGPTDPAGLSPGTAQFVNEQTITLPGEALPISGFVQTGYPAYGDLISLDHTGTIFQLSSNHLYLECYDKNAVAKPPHMK